ncbi:DUF4342 domain-containing protein [Clostridium bowmanii]|uniref:DUF4342 domain-containing protein n=1 Tax=Clostridium bowmanii TaxID=132925 RepID=UPI001C0B8DD1|nr:DUF4342 domain-containing protein [Clostridium bowmanii]MBU3189694.1 DUF4342 domain-containing protein [Clostridium bowmanii]MCA1074176.1 DUF4342 domain-containing protein [Clostridium bowmanii]
MAEITLEKIDIIKERTGVSYTEAKEALEECDSDVVNALIYIEAKQKKYAKFNMEEMYSTKDEFVTTIKDIVKKGNVTRIKIKKDDTVVIDIPVNAGIAAGLIGLYNPVLIALGLLTAVLTKVTVEITKADGSVEVVNTIIKNTVEDVKSRMSDMTGEVKEKYNDTKDTFTKNSKSTKDDKEENVYQYTVKFDKESELKKEEKKEEKEEEK